MSRACRLAAYLIALAALLDPGFERERPAPLTLGLRLAADAGSDASAIGERLRARLGDDGVVVVEPATTTGKWCVGVDVCVAVVDGTLPLAGEPGTAVDLIRLPPPPTSRLVAAHARPGHVAELGTVQVAIAGGPAGASLDVVVEDDGVEVGRRTFERSAALVDQEIDVPWWPPSAGARALDVHLEVNGEVIGARRDTVPATVAEGAVDVLVWEARPSWTGTFVRRALQDDPRVVVRAVSEVAPGRLVGRGASGRPSDDTLFAAQAVVVGGVDGLDGDAVERLQRYVRAGGALILPLDGLPRGPARALVPDVMGAPRSAATPMAVGARLRATEVVGFDTSEGDVTLASLAAPSAATVVVERPTGRGRVVVSGALDAWRWRADDAGFDAFWRDTVVGAARRAGPSVSASWTETGPRQPPTLEVVARARDQQATWSPFSATLSCPDGTRQPLQASPSSRPGAWRIDEVQAAAGCVIEARAGDTATTSAWPGPSSLPARAPDLPAIESWVRGSGGTVSPATEAEAVLDTRLATLPRRFVPETLYPMRAWWWLIPFVAALGAEWWLRRRRGLA